MFWQEEKDDSPFTVPDAVVDVPFTISCRALPVDHAEALSDALIGALPWFADESRAGIHLIHGADSGNGWERPEDPDEVIYLSRRTPLTLRLPKGRVADAAALSGTNLQVGESAMSVEKAREPRLLSTSHTLYARYVIGAEGQDEETFLAEMVAALQAMGLRFKKVLCGKQTTLKYRDGELTVRSLLVANLSPEDAVRLQEEGIGPHRKLGCGLFIPHKLV